MAGIISKPALSRLVRLSRLLEQLEQNAQAQGISGPLTVSSAELQELTGWTRDTIRRDISLLDANCAGAAGYKVPELKNAIIGRLNIQREEKRCCLVGLGRLGSALMEYEGFRNSSFKITAGFDTNVNLVETLRAPFPLYTTVHLERVIGEERIEIAILAVPAAAAQTAANKLVGCGIRGIVNFTAAVLTIPPGVKIETVSVLDALQRLTAASALAPDVN